MRPNFVQLIVPTIYDRLDSHPSVYTYSDVRGMRDNLYFYTHDVFEDSEVSLHTGYKYFFIIVSTTPTYRDQCKFIAIGASSTPPI